MRTECLRLEILLRFLIFVIRATAQLIAKEVSDGVIAPGYDDDAFGNFERQEKRKL